jgi:hypothetical protein
MNNLALVKPSELAGHVLDLYSEADNDGKARIVSMMASALVVFSGGTVDDAMSIIDAAIDLEPEQEEQFLDTFSKAVKFPASRRPRLTLVVPD